MNLQQCLHYLLFLISEASYHSLCVYLWAMHKFASVIRDYPHLSQGKQKKKPLLFLRAIKHWHRSWSGPSREDAERCRESPSLERLKPWRDTALGNQLWAGGWTTRPPELPSSLSFSETGIRLGPTTYAPARLARHSAWSRVPLFCFPLLSRQESPKTPHFFFRL